MHVTLEFIYVHVSANWHSWVWQTHRYVHCENRSLIQSLALMHSAITAHKLWTAVNEKGALQMLLQSSDPRKPLYCEQLQHCKWEWRVSLHSIFIFIFTFIVPGFTTSAFSLSRSMPTINLTNEARHYLYKQEMTKEALQNHCMGIIYIARLTGCGMWAYFQEKYHNSWKYTNPPLWRAT